MAEKTTEVTEQILDLLLEALYERQKAREELGTAPVIKNWSAVGRDAYLDAVSFTSQPDMFAKPEVVAVPKPEDVAEPEPVSEPEPPTELESLIEPEIETAVSSHFYEKLPSIHMEKMVKRIVILLLLVIVLVNIPYDRYGTNLARAMPDERALIIRDGLLLKGSGPEVYVLENNQRRWITTIDAFNWYGYQWANVHEVDDEFLEGFNEGIPIHLLLKCNQSPHVYALESGVKRWIKDIPTFNEKGYVWEDIQFVTCAYLRELPDGETIPKGAGQPPRP